MQADLLDAHARLRAKVRQLIADLRRLGVTDDAMRGKTLLDLDAMYERELSRSMQPSYGR